MSETITNGRYDYVLSPRESFRRPILIQDENGAAINLTGSTIQLFIKPLIISAEPTVTLSTGISDVSVANLVVSTIPSTFPDKGFLAIEDEIIRYDAKTLTFDSITRGADESVAAAHLAGETVTLAGRIIDDTGPIDENLTIVPLTGSITPYISDELIDQFTWSRAEFRYQMIDSNGDIKQLFAGYFIVDRRWAQ